MHTSALATASAPTPAPAASYVYRGRLVQRAEARTGISQANGHAVPVVCFVMELDNALKTRMDVQQPFPEGAFHAAQAAANRLKAGTHVEIEHPIAAVRIVGNLTTHVHVIHDPQE